MAPNAKITAFILALATSGTVAAGAQAAYDGDGAKAARAAWADRHIQLVCRPLELQGLRQRARTCYENAARAAADTTTDFRDVTASVGPARTAEPAANAGSGRMNRCSGISCIERFPMIGVGF